MAEKEKIAVLGGGTAGMTTAYYLTSTPELREKYEVTVYQLGWRLGGKGASGRNQKYGYRIEEHGLHIWLGFYDNSFKTIQDCYAALARSPQAPLATWDAAFKPHNFVLLNEHYNNDWMFWPIDFPIIPGVPGDGGILPNFWQLVAMSLGWLWEILKDLIESDTDLFKEPPPTEKPDWWQKIVERVEADFEHAEKGFIGHFELAVKLATHNAQHPHSTVEADAESILCSLMTDFKNWLWPILDKNFSHDKLRAFWIMLDTGSTILCGMIADGVLKKGFDFLDDEEFSHWLLRHGLKENPTLNGPPVRGVYDLAFAYEHGKTRNIAAGVGLRGLIRLGLTYKGAFYWMMQAGMGDTVFTPLYQVLQRRGVKFKFFHCVTNLSVGSDKQISAITVQPQVNLTVGEYNPLIMVKELPCWPSEPLWDQIDPAQAAILQEKNIDVEEVCQPFPEIPAITLEHGKDFDSVVLAISIAALDSICGELRSSSSFAAMLDHIPTTQTQAFQLWVNQDEKLLGLPENTGIMDTYVEPVDTYANMSHLIIRENWRSDLNLQNIAYFCGVIEDVPGENQADADRRAKKYALDYLHQHLAHIWPNALTPEGDFKWDILVDPSNQQGAERFDSQYWRANFVPTERYVLSVAGSTKYRLKAHQTDFPNLYLAGDWTHNGMNAGCIEATVMSGMQASRAICGVPQTILGENDDWITGEGSVTWLQRK